MKKKYLPIFAVVLLTIISISVYIYAKQSANQIIDFHKGTYVGAKKCKECHQENYDSWKKTYHRSMTQEANSDSVVGQFNGVNQTYWGITIRPVKKNNKFYFEYYNPKTGDLINILEIKRTVGSRRYQQYLAQTENTKGNYYRLELLWHIQDKRWIHMNGVFLGSDNQSFNNHTALWNQNCIFCHNTGVTPNLLNYNKIIAQTKAGKPLDLKKDSRFDSSVADLGIGCESCHANGDEHISLNQNPIRKYYLHYSKADDKSIVNPKKLSAKKSMDICGQCHGQRTPKTYAIAREWMERGPTYRPGDILQTTVNPVWKNSKLSTRKSETFKQRFWKDGTPRLSAYEYQGILQSQCHIKGELSCNNCHSMHEGNPKGMIKDIMLTNTACVSCHKNYAQNIEQHTGHKNNSDGSLCYNCHMPKIVYGIMTFHRSHKIESPKPIYEFKNDKPNACIACHTDKSAKWVVQESNKIWPGLNPSNNYDFTALLQSIYKLHSGDPVERAIAAKNMSYKGILNADEKLFLIPHLLFAMSDSYPAVRRFAYKSLKQILTSNITESNQLQGLYDSISIFDFITDVYRRTSILKQAWKEFSQVDKSQWISPPKGVLLDKYYKINRKSLLKLREISMKETKLINIGE